MANFMQQNQLLYPFNKFVNFAEFIRCIHFNIPKEFSPFHFKDLLE